MAKGPVKLVAEHSKVALTIISALAGAVLGAVVQNLLQFSFNLLMAIVGLLSLTVLALMASQLGLADQITGRTKAIEQSVKQSNEEQAANLQEMTGKLWGSMSNLGSQFGLQVGRLLLSEVNSFKSAGEDSSAQMICSIQEDLRILDIVAEDGSWPDAAMNQDLLAGVFKEMIRMTEDPASPISYRRIIQVPDLNTGLGEVKNSTLLTHCKEILRVRHDKGHRASLRMAKRRFPFKFVLIDRSQLILQLQEYDDKNDAFKLWGELQISDPSHNLVSIFKDIWDEIDDANDTRNVTLDDLPQLSE